MAGKHHNDYVTKLTTSVDQYPGNPFVTLRDHLLHPAGGSEQVCTYGVIALRKRLRREQRKQRMANLLTFIKHCLFDGSDVMCILCNITHMPLWYSSKRVTTINNMVWSTKVRGCIHAPVNCFIIGSIRGMYRSDGLVPVQFWGNHYPQPFMMSIFNQGNGSTHAKLSPMFSLKGINFILKCQHFCSVSNVWTLASITAIYQRRATGFTGRCSTMLASEMVEGLTCKRDAGNTATGNSSNVFYNTVKPVYNDHLMGYFSAFWSSSRWPRAT